MATTTAALTRIEAAFQDFSSAPGSALVNLTLYADSGTGTLGTAIETFSDVGPATATPSIFSVNSSLQPALTVGTTYWLVASPARPETFLVWKNNDQNIRGNTVSIARDGAAVVYNPRGTQAAFRVTGFVVPEPSSLALCGLATILAAACMRNRLLPACV